MVACCCARSTLGRTWLLTRPCNPCLLPSTISPTPPPVFAGARPAAQCAAQQRDDGVRHHGCRQNVRQSSPIQHAAAGSMAGAAASCQHLTGLLPGLLQCRCIHAPAARLLPAGTRLRAPRTLPASCHARWWTCLRGWPLTWSHWWHAPLTTRWAGRAGGAECRGIVP